ncbi:glycosyltransferase family 1 protein [Rathayibacter sp. VKM Ac-2856]|uniref:glycosyltransferase family 1 protein n=1 Tax=unclassified Rathayibacter TaxID=2609250 RepID=UPI00156344B1|nr:MULTISPECIES: glycosyltransferase family 1 protein [unclassified Rathayibacter]NQX06067.1 glycosyltransferase family 1 protein [Rathayibacter sp. VKM Ac-2858]NQX20983.1 glycosyltransferase family 1 protein [Rathayibacter sp. VKM Ac-2856]
MIREPDSHTGTWTDVTLVYVAPRSGSSGVSDYADDLIARAREVAGTVVEVRHGGAGADGVAELLRARRETLRAIDAAPGPVIVHTEHSGGVIVPFWLLASRRLRSRATVVTATLHDAPLAVWTPFRTALVGRSHFATHAIHYPLMRLHRLLERRVLRGVSLFALTASGAQAIREELRVGGVDVAFLPAPVRPAVAPAPERPLAIGLFGYVYRGKGFDQLAALRDAVDPAIEIVVAGRGTEALEPVPGVRVLGGVEGEDEDRFFASVRAIVLPYSRRGAYGPTIHVASSVVARALAYRTPIIALSHPGLSDEADVVEGGVRELADRINAVVPDDAAIGRLAEHSSALAERLTSAEAFAVFARRWRALLDGARL